jgi:hypothetical protein
MGPSRAQKAYFELCLGTYRTVTDIPYEILVVIASTQ